MSWFYLSNVNTIEELVTIKKGLGSNIIVMNQSTALNQPKNTPKKPTIIKQYPCPTCGKLHTLKISQEILDRADQFPISYLTLIPENPDTKYAAHLILLYVDARGSVRGVEGIKFFDIPLCYEEVKEVKK